MDMCSGTPTYVEKIRLPVWNSCISASLYGSQHVLMIAIVSGNGCSCLSSQVAYPII